MFCLCTQLNSKHKTVMALVLALLQLLWLSVSSSPIKEGLPISKPYCNNSCGNVTIPYPFGIGSNCSFDSSYEIICDQSFDPPKPFLGQHNYLEVTDINWPGRYSRRDPRYYENDQTDDQRLTVLTPAKNICGSSSLVLRSADLRESPFRFSSWFNVFMVDNYCGRSVRLKNRKGETLAGCASVCPSDINTNSSLCYGIGCCQASLLPAPNQSDSYIDRQPGLDFYEITIDPDARRSGDPNTCTLSAALVESTQVMHLTGKLKYASKLPTVLEWKATASTLTLSINPLILNFSCYVEGEIPKCSCEFPYEGNPYLPNGCQVIRECRRCRHRCDIDFISNPHHLRYYCENPWLRRGSIIGFSTSIGVVILFLSCYWLYRVVKKKKEDRLKAKYFKRNGGLLLEQHVSSTEGGFEKTKIFRVSELEKATNNFSKDRILGQGGQGTVYKGMLTDGKIVAVKKSKLIDDESQLEHFINELVILSQINHRNVVKILGCCLETEVPLLIYEYIPNGTLYHLLQASSQDFHLAWKMRLQIAVESANALAYLHSSSATPIYHRDIKSSNILLDEKYRAKVSDFGTSRAITVEQTHVTTCVMGTYGYLDPEYFQSNQFTEKSDVYSFGVLLVELITGKKPICPTKDGGWISLASEFLGHMEISRLSHILDARVVDEAKEEEFIAVAKLAKQCLNMSGKLRPSMKEIVAVLDGVRSNKVLNSEEPHSETAKCVIDETSDRRRAALTAYTFSLDKRPSSSRSIEVQPPMPCTF